MNVQNVMIKERFNREFGALVAQCLPEMNGLFHYLSSDHSGACKQEVLGMNPLAKMVLVTLYYTARETAQATVEHEQMRREYFYEELYLNYRELFVQASHVDREHEVDFVMDAWATQEAQDRFYTLIGASQTIFVLLNGLTVLHEDLKEMADWSVLQVDWDVEINHYMLQAIIDFQAAYGTKIMRRRW